jgi:hypothetical protein
MNYGKEKSNSKFYKICFYAVKDFLKINRSFMKFQDFAAIVGGFIKITSVVCTLITYFYTKSKYYQYLTYELFDCYEDDRNNPNGSNESNYGFLPDGAAIKSEPTAKQKNSYFEDFSNL